MYDEFEIELEKMKQVFGSNTNLLMRNGMDSVEAVKEYIEKYPFEEYSVYRGKYYRNIGPVKYKQILEALNKMEES